MAHKLYLAHLSFATPGTGDQWVVGHFTCSCRASSVEDAAERIALHVAQVQLAEALVPAGATVRLDALLEVGESDEPVITGLSKMSVTGPITTIDQALPVDRDGVRAFAVDNMPPVTQDASGPGLDVLDVHAPNGDDDSDGDLDTDLDDPDDNERLMQEPLWLVRWPDLSAALIRAHSKHEVRMTMDELADPGGCDIQPYEGPLWFELELPAKIRFPDAGGRDVIHPLEPKDVTIERANSLLDPGRILDVSFGPTETGAETHDALLDRAFPVIAQARQELDLDAAPTKKSKARIREAAMQELAPLFRRSWRGVTQQRRAAAGDPDAVLRELLGVTVDLDDPEDDN
jgi:hypothetical protein